MRKSGSWNPLWSHKGKTLKSQLLKKPSIEFYEIQDLDSPNGKPKLLFYGYNWDFFSPGNHLGELWEVKSLSSRKPKFVQGFKSAILAIFQKVKCDQVENRKKIFHHIARTNPKHFDSMNDWSESSLFKRTNNFLVR